MSNDDSNGNGEPVENSLRSKAKSVTEDRIGPFNPEKHAKPNRVKILDTPGSERNLIFKGCREDNDGVVDMFCDSLYAKLGNAFGVPTPKQVPLHLEELGLGIVSPEVNGEQGIQAPSEEFDNSSQIPILVTFEEWIVNHDDKPDHFWIVNGERKELWIVDHGHTVPRHPHLTGPQEARESNQLEGPASNNNHFFDSVNEVQKGIDVIKSAEDEEIIRTIELVLDEFEQLDIDDPRMDAFLENKEGYKLATVVALKRRKDNIESIMEQKYS